MPFENAAPMRRKIAVIGAGIAGMGAAYRLSQAHDVTLVEAEKRLGGHARTVIAGRRGDQPVDTGFIVFNYPNYPNLSRLFDELGVPVTKSNMSFGASVRGGRLEYGLDGAGAFFAQKRNALDPRFLGMLRDIFRFNSRAVGLAETCPDLTIGAFLDRLKTGVWFRDYYLLPLTGAIWSTPTSRILDFPARAMIGFLQNHALLNYSGQHQWYTVAGGSRAYVERIERALVARGVRLAIGAPVKGLRRAGGMVLIRVEGGEWECFDDVVLATHGDDSLRLLSDPSTEELRALSAVRYQSNDVILHADATVMPRRRSVWSAWNYAEEPARRAGQIDITYWMNRLQPIPAEDPHFVTLNSNRPIREALIYDSTVMRHPVYDRDTLAAQALVRGFNGTNNTWFCGAWMGHGFHEDGLASGLDVADRIIARHNLPVAAE